MKAESYEFVGEAADRTKGRRSFAVVLVDADADGYVAMPRMNPAEDMVDLVGANRSYQANVAAMSAVKDMIQKSIDLLR